MDLILAVLLVWTVPVTREGGSELQPDEIGHYEVSRKGEPYTVTTENHIGVDRNGSYAVRACDVDGRCSDFSNSVRVKIKGRRQ